MCPFTIMLGLTGILSQQLKIYLKQTFFILFTPPIVSPVLSSVLHVSSRLALPVDQGADQPPCICMVGQISKQSCQVNFDSPHREGISGLTMGSFKVLGQVRVATCLVECLPRMSEGLALAVPN